MKINLIKAFHGESILISCYNNSKKFNILVDGGTSNTYGIFLKKELRAIREKSEYIDLLIITHIDDDHIGGIKKIF